MAVVARAVWPAVTASPLGLRLRELGTRRQPRRQSYKWLLDTNRGTCVTITDLESDTESCATGNEHWG